MNRVIAMIAYNRPDYLSQVIDGLNGNPEFHGYTLVAAVEPGRPECVDALCSARCEKKQIIINKERLGMDGNSHTALTAAFALSDFVIFMEDDCVPGPDALAYFEHCRLRYADDASVFTVGGYNRLSESPGIDKSHLIARREFFTCWGWATWIDRWNEMRDSWGIQDQPGQWAETMCHVHRKERHEVFPVLSRIQNIGVHGENVSNYTPEWFAENHHVPFWSGNTAVADGPWQEVSA